MLNVCTPSAEEQKEIASALARVPKQPLFGADFEVSRGRSTLDRHAELSAARTERTHVAGEPSVASYVRIRREFSVQALFSSVQYSFSNDGQNMVETLVLHVRDPKDLIQVSLEDSASSVTSSEAMLASNTPASRVRLERFGKSSVALARCLGDRRRSAAGSECVRAAVPQRVRSAGELSRAAGCEEDGARGVGKESSRSCSDAKIEAQRRPKELRQRQKSRPEGRVTCICEHLVSCVLSRTGGLHRNLKSAI